VLYTSASTNYVNNQIVWSAWNASNTSISITNYDLWRIWNQQVVFTTAATVNTINVWPAWMERQQVITSGAIGHHVAPRARPTDDEVRARLAQEEAWRKAAQEKAEKAARAQARAEQLLRSCLSPEQIESLETRGHFYVDVDGGRERYRIDRGSHGNVKQVDKNNSLIRSFCIQPEGVPVPDIMLTQKLWLEASEETRAKFWETANITTLMREKDVPAHIPRNQRRRYAAEHGLLH